MVTYVSLIQFTEKGATKIRESTKRAQAFDDAAEAAGVEIVSQYWTIGSYDGVLVVRAESEQKLLHWLTELISYGNVKSESLRAFTAEEFDGILG
jgi:uncharacterized protein with GYD domain